MCGIVGFIGEEKAAPILLEGLSKLEYRGYDSAGIAVINRGEIDVAKSKGRLEVLSGKLDGSNMFESCIGIGHTRWATHGRPSDENSHPHKSSSGRFVVVHNGIIENYASLREDLKARGYEFQSETDTEVIAQLLEDHYDGSDFKGTVVKVTSKLEGSYALGILCADHPDEIIAVRNASPLIIGLSDKGNFIASDIPAILSHTRRIYRLEDDEIAVLRKDSVDIFTPDLIPVYKKVEEITWDVSAAEKGGYDHFMLKEIMEQPNAIQETVSPRINNDGEIVLDGIHLTAGDLKKLRKIYIVACGSAYHVGVVGKYVLERMTRIPVETDLASEFRYRDPIVDDSTLVIIISQSGETADSIAALRLAREKGARVLSVVNVVGSTIANESDDVLYTWAGPEIAVATTKAYSTQVVMIYLIALYIAHKLELIDDNEMRGFLTSILKLPERIAHVLKENEESIQKIAQKFKDCEHIYFIGRNLDYAVALEASLKLKEISYIHSEAYAAGELKHGSISLIEDGTPVIALAACTRLFDKTKSNVVEVISRGARVLAVTTSDNTAIEDVAEDVIYLPRTRELLMPSLEVVPMQLLSYYVALARGCDIDKPRNLAKSVTVE